MHLTTKKHSRAFGDLVNSVQTTNQFPSVICMYALSSKVGCLCKSMRRANLPQPYRCPYLSIVKFPLGTHFLMIKVLKDMN